MLKQAQILFLLENSEDEKELFFDNEQYQVIKQAIDTFPWRVVSQEIANLVTDIQNAEEVELEPKVDKEKSR